MCFAVYIGTNEKQITEVWKENETLLYFEELSQDDKVVKTKFSKPFVYFVGADTCCSCGFVWKVENFDNPAEQENKKSPQKLIDFITAMTIKEDIEFYCCWENDWGKPISETLELNIKDVSLDKYYFIEEGRFILFRHQSAH